MAETKIEPGPRDLWATCPRCGWVGDRDDLIEARWLLRRRFFDLRCPRCTLAIGGGSYTSERRARWNARWCKLRGRA